MTDFGIAKSPMQDRGGYIEHVIGRPSYMSPEQTAPGVLDGRFDQYSLAVVAYELLTGRVPFEEKSAPPLIRAITSVDPSFGSPG